MEGMGEGGGVERKKNPIQSEVIDSKESETSR